MFILLQQEDKELLINTDHIWKVEVSYSDREAGRDWSVSASKGTTNIASQRRYVVFVGSERIPVPADPNHPFARLIGEIYKKATKL